MPEDEVMNLAAQKQEPEVQVVDGKEIPGPEQGKRRCP